MTMPNFLVIGAQKSGSTSLHNYLNQHPQIYMSPMKEPHFFLEEYLEKGQYYPGQKVKLWHNRITTIEAYEHLFEGVTNQKAIGESSVWYLYRPNTAMRIKQYLPNVKMIAILRDPVERCFSDFKQGIAAGYETRYDFSQALLEDQKSLQDHTGTAYHYIPQGFYSEQLKRYLDVFDREQIKVYLYEDLKLNPKGLLGDIFRFLEVDDSFSPDISQKHNVSSLSYEVLESRYEILRPLLKHKNLIQETMRLFVRHLFRQKLKARLMKLTNTMKLTKTITPVFDPNLRQQLVDIYRDDITQLEKLIQRDLSKWLQ